MSRDSENSNGFTIVELLLAMSFVTMLLLLIALTVMQIGNIYNKGLTMRAVNQAGRTITADIRHSLSASQPFEIERNFKLNINPDNRDDSYGGRLCTGVYSYVWNRGKWMDNQENSYEPGTGAELLRLVRVRDNGGQYCADITKEIQRDRATELLSSDDGDLAVQSFDIKLVAEDKAAAQALYRVVIEIGTNSKDTLQQISSIDTRCRPPSDENALVNHCAVNRFIFTAQAGNKGSE